MTLIWDIERAGLVRFGDAIRYLESMGDRLFHEDLDSTAEVLRGLFDDRDFISSFLQEVLICNPDGNDYSSQVFVMHRSKYFTLRVVLWEAPQGLPGEEIFLYELPHDHDFSFFTLGYYGPGYETVVKHYDHFNVVGLPGEGVSTDGNERWLLKEQRVVFYEGGKDIHCQMPPSSLSISFNVLQDINAFGIRRRQYEFDRDFSRIRRVINVNPVSLLVRAACALGGEGVKYVEEVASTGGEYERAVAFKALVAMDSKYRLSALKDESIYVRAMVL
ncbi:TPA: hypothetical protein ACGCGJ_002054 [Stenotrophomonas maltophilia]|uniref:hypothetical protein n=1 Tax=Stenotrophomonas maltophilia TaxID=40324 RepID=UPI000DA8AA34|nr:hypothetical protein [Stenotrophomonas maltophilia]PZS99896.1 hypothetical protein A7X66_03945 [Stenotrophomonas maltophilia]UXF77234.1 hypothetical protein K7573_03185 [Stenotrophomonas maltophilia]